MLHVVPILCLLFFVFFIEIRLKNHIDENDKKVEKLSRKVDIIVKALNKLMDESENRSNE